jgi:hypothetical protein
MFRIEVTKVSSRPAMDDEGNFLFDEFEKLLTSRTKVGGDHAHEKGGSFEPPFTD